MSSKLINICATKDQADFAEQRFIAAGYTGITKEQIEDCTIEKVTGPPFKTQPEKYYDDSAGQLWIVIATVA